MYVKPRLSESTSATETGPLRANVRPLHVLRRTVAVTRGRNFESSAWPPRLIKNPFIPSQFMRLFCASLRVGRCMELQVWRHTSSSGFFQGHQLQEGLGAVDAFFAGLEHCEHRKIQLSCPWRSDPKPWRQIWYRRTVWLSSEWHLNQRGLRNYFYTIKKFVRSHHKEK